MSGDPRSQATGGDDAQGDGQIAKLLEDMARGEGDSPVDEEELFDAEPEATRTLEAALDEVQPHQEFRFDEELVKQNLEPVLLLLISLDDRGSHGKRLRDQLAQVFDARLSPGTVYPALHELESDDVLEMHEQIRTKEYEIDDPGESKRRLLDTMYQHLALGYLIYASLDDL